MKVLTADDIENDEDLEGKILSLLWEIDAEGTGRWLAYYDGVLRRCDESFVDKFILKGEISGDTDKFDFDAKNGVRYHRQVQSKTLVEPRDIVPADGSCAPTGGLSHYGVKPGN